MNAVAIETQASTTNTSWSKNFTWLVKRELWEHRALYIAPLVFAAVLIVGTVFAAIKFGNVHIGDIDLDGPGKADFTSARFFLLGAFSIPFAGIAAVVSLYYALDSLYADRRDRSVLFWKSLPLSDTETVAAKLVVASVVGPFIALIVSIVTLVIIFTMVSIWLGFHGKPINLLWSQLPLIDNIVFATYALLAQILWYLPITAWCLLASAWARRGPFLWAVVPVGGAWLLEWQIFGTNFIGHTLLTRFSGALPAATSIAEHFGKGHAEMGPAAVVQGVTDIMTPGAYFASAQLWGGLLVAGGLLAATVWLRRFRESA